MTRDELITALVTERFAKPTPPPPKRSATPSQMADLLAELYPDADAEDEVA